MDFLVDKKVSICMESTEVVIPTPDLTHLSSKDYQVVYEPSEDTFLLLDALNKERRYILDELQPKVCLEIG